MPSRVLRAPRSPEKRVEITPVLWATSLSFNHRKLYSNSFRNCTCKTPRVVDFFSKFLPEKGKAMYSHSAIQSVERVLNEKRKLLRFSCAILYFTGGRKLANQPNLTLTIYCFMNIPLQFFISK